MKFMSDFLVSSPLSVFGNENAFSSDDTAVGLKLFYYNNL